MGTRSTIALEFADGTVQQVYCHWDGYLSNNGRILAEHYSNPFKVKELVSLGGFSSLQDTVEETAESAYTQRGESLDINKYTDIGDYERNCHQEEYDYCLRCINGVATWFVRSYATTGWITLATAIELAALETESEDWY